MPAKKRSVDDVGYVYVVRCADDSLYIGFAYDVVARVAAHGAGRGARYTRARRPVCLCWQWRTTRERARRLEGLLKRLSRAGRQRLVRGNVDVLLPVLVEVSRRVQTSARNPGARAFDRRS